MALARQARYRALDLWQTPDDGNRYEVVDGMLYVSPPPRLAHQGASDALHSYLGPYVRRHRLGKLFAAPVGLVLDDENGLQPDLVYVSNEWAGLLTEKRIEGVPDLVIESLSPRTRSRDLGVKTRRYARAGIPHDWTADPRTRALRVHQLVGGEYELAGEHGPGPVFRPELFPGLEIPIDELWA